MSELALQLIAENKKTRSPFLDLGNCGLTEVPAEIGELVWLEELSFASKWFFDSDEGWVRRTTQSNGPLNILAQLAPKISPGSDSLSVKPVQTSPFEKLINLKKLYLNGELSDSERMVFTDIEALSGLTALQWLDVSNTQITELSPLSGLTALQWLDVSNTQITELSPLSGLTSLQWLDVSRTQITELSPLSGLTALQQLNFSHTQITELSPLSGLTALQELDVSHTQITDLSPLLGLIALRALNVLFTQITEVSPLSGLTALQKLYVSGTQITELPSLSDLTALQVLYVSSTQITELSPLSGLTSLQWLDVSRTQITELSPLSGLTALQVLYVSNTQITELSPLSGLKALQLLDVSDTQITDLGPLIELIKNDFPVKWSSSFWEGNGIYVEDCPLTNPPAEIVKQGNAAILNYFDEKAKQGTDRLFEAKMLIIGEGSAGKTSLLRRLYQPEKALPDEKETTKGIDIHRHDFKLSNGRNFRLNVWDFGGQEIYHATHQFFLTKRSLYVLLDDTRKDDKSVHDPAFKYWLEVADLLGDHSPVLIFQNEKGGRSKQIDESGIKGKFSNVKDVYRGNLEQPGSVDALRKAVEFHAQNLPHIGEQLPAKWVDIRADIEQQARDKSFISQQDYFALYAKHLEFDKSKALHLSRYLHDLGVFLHFQDEPLLARTVILQNTWATEAVFKMLDDESVKAKLGHFDNADCKRVWRDSIYADMHPELLALMQKFELCYRLPDESEAAWLAPQLLPPSRPETLTVWHQPGDLTLRYRYEFLPKGIVSRLIVRMHRFIKRPELSWISGALFERDGSELLIEVPAKGSEIALRARGPERKELLSVIAADLDALNDSFHGLKELVGKWVPCHCDHCRELIEPYYFEHKSLLERKRRGIQTIQCDKSYQDMSVLELLDGVRVDRMPVWAEDENPPRTVLLEAEKQFRTIKIFLASSAELKEDRDAFDLYFRQQNDRLRKQGLYLEIVRWENFLDAMSETRLQDEYNKEVKACDIFVSLFFSKTGKYTEEEFDTAHQQFLLAKKPVIYTFFKNAPLNTDEINDEILSLLNFKKKLASFGHFYTSYDNIEHLKRQFMDQLEKLREKGF